MAISYDNKRKDITFCTMLFKMPAQEDLASIKKMNRKFEEFYLPSIKNLIKTFKKVALWCDKQTAQAIIDAGLEKYVYMRVMDFKELPHYKEKEEWLKILDGMRGKRGFFFHNKTPKDWIDYLLVINAKPSMLEWAASENKFNTKYFMWIDAGSFNPFYANFWENWNGTVLAKPERVRITIAPTMGKTRPHYVPNFVYRLYRKYCCAPVKDATRESLVKQNLCDIAMINSDYDVPACSVMATAENIHRFYNWFETVRRIMKKHGFVSTEQAVFQMMMKLDVDNLFELSYIRGYTGVYAGVAKEKPDYLL